MQSGNSTMYQRIIEIERYGTKLRVSNGLLCIEHPEAEAVKVPLKTCAVLLISNPAISLSGAVLAEFAVVGGVVVVCDRSWVPVASLLPHMTTCDQTQVLAAQIAVSLPTKKRIWKDLITHKIRNHAAVLEFLGADSREMRALASAVRSGDTSNMEARAAKLYWKLVNIVHRRNRKSQDANILLNYAYTLLCAAMARALIASGLNLSLGIHHHNKYNPYCLASDMMEPYRFFAEIAVIECLRQTESTEFASRESRLFISRFLTSQKVKISGSFMALSTALRLTASSLRAKIEKPEGVLILPEGEWENVASCNV